MKFSMKVLAFLFCVTGVFLLGVSCFWEMNLIEMELSVPGSICLHFSLFLDQVSVIFVGTVLLISGSVLNYTSWYMGDEVYFKRFVYLVLIFVLSMCFLITFCNLVTLLLGWDGLGISSFALVVYYQNNKSLGGGMMTVMVNRVGDVLLLICIGLFSGVGSWMLYEWDLHSMSKLSGLCLCLGAMTKSAQFPFSAWLPAAMAAPTPVSSLVHSSTLVTAGVYLLIRSSDLIYYSDGSVVLTGVLMTMSVTTLMLAGLAASVEVDVKKIIAFSTLSQLGVMIFCISVGFPLVSFFHLVSHALFKSLLFLCAGVIIHNNLGSQDVRMLGMNMKNLPVTSVCMLVCSMSLCGVPFLSGFFSKEMVILVSVLGTNSLLMYGFLMFGLGLTSFYCVRFSVSCLWKEKRGENNVLATKEDLSLYISFFLLFLGAVTGGSVIGASMDLFVISFYTPLAMMVSVFFILVILGPLLFSYSSVLAKVGFMYYVNWFMSSMWHLKFLTSGPTAWVANWGGDLLFMSVDKGILSHWGPDGTDIQLSSLVYSNESFMKNYFIYSLKSIVVMSVTLFILFFIW